MTETVTNIHNWLKTGGFKFGDTSKLPLSLELCDEELNELKEAVQNLDIQGIMDAVCDLSFVINNVTLFSGIDAEILGRYNSAVEKSNWSKYCSNQKEAEDTIEAYRSGSHPSKIGTRIDSYYEKVGYYYVIYRHDGKILKSINYHEPQYFLENDREK